MPQKKHHLSTNPYALAHEIKQLGKRIGFHQVRIAKPKTDRAAMQLKRWQQLDNAGEMTYLQRHGLKRGNIETITSDCLSVISVSLEYLPDSVDDAQQALDNTTPYISVYARNRDYHKVMRKMLAQFAKSIEVLLETSLKTRAFVDTAPILDKAYAEQSGLGWVGKHTNILDRYRGSFYFLGELAVNINLPRDYPVKPRCGSCTACIDVCPTKAIIAPYQLDAEKCISYLTIEYDGVIPNHFKTAIGNRIYGCDDCQLFCPWNRYAKKTPISDFHTREVFKNSDYVTLFSWDEMTFLKKTEGSPIRRIGHHRWQRNLAIAMGNVLQKSLSTEEQTHLIKALKQNKNSHPAVKEAISWALTKIPPPQ